MQARYIKSETNEVERLTTHIMDVPYLMPGTIIFVHGVNSEGEWYEQAAEQFCAGLNKRLGRNCLKSAKFDPVTKRFAKKATDGTDAHSPIIPFYWGYKLQAGDMERYPGIYHAADNAWGGGPFQNGTNNLLSFWQGGFKRKLLAGLLDLQKINPEINRQLEDAPPRTYYIHAARRLANLIDTLREDFPNEPLNVVAHSQGNMIALCAILYLKRRAPDTLILNSAPYAFDTNITDWLAATNGWSGVQSGEARLKTFRAVADKIKAAKDDYADDEKNADCAHVGIKDQTTMHVHHEAERDDWHQQIGAAKVNDEGHQWQQCEHASRDNRGKVFVNFNPHDRVIGVAAVEGIGWRGIPERIISEHANRLPNVYQRVFARNSGGLGTPAVGERQNYWFSYFHEQMRVREKVRTGSGGYLLSSDGTPVRTENSYLKTFDGKPEYEFWNPPPRKVLGVFDLQGTPKQRERVWINAPTVPAPAHIAEDFNLHGQVRFDGSDAGDSEQNEDFATFSRHYVPQTITVRGADGQTISRKENPGELKARLAAYAGQPIAQTDHSQILRYGSAPGQAHPVEQVLSYDLTIGQGHAFGDADYWQYLLDLADWKISDPYYQNGVLPAPGGYPAGLDTETVAPKDAR
ncbi:putative uncharacterized protein [Janthinobacterium agaricidamnosum NBRC 102515 = DSM 9628]|uniref:Transmembrane protein n=2 Tax=Janthinobacterium agaricidamnosum TaxID=55508 RepID=W0VF87_9BURK|nr:putative uncharacterized protein [Janthinobacterium agaricidamnosum NBRC 102515 = DSM 9628]